MNTKKTTLIPLLAVLILLSGMFKIPAIFPGGEYQLSASVSVMIALIFGMELYLYAGVLASVLSFILSVSNVFNILVALIFRMVVALFILVVGKKKITLIGSSICGTVVARIVLSLILHVNFKALILPVIPGMIFTSFINYFLYFKIYDLLNKTHLQIYIKERVL
ncbi:MAG: hypothetical protein Q4P25_01535 [Tissierellia bacterium]|nr:hypothetical protein [Tissierellia bacterium]